MKTELNVVELGIITADLYGRAPWNTCFVQFPNDKIFGELCNTIQRIDLSNVRRIVLNIKYHVCFPYLRKLSSITAEERQELDEISYGRYLNEKIYDDPQGYGVPINELYSVFDWLNKHCFDYRGLIEMGLAIEAPEGMYNFNKQN